MKFRIISHLLNGFGWGACEMPDSTKLCSSKFHSGTFGKLFWPVAHLQMDFVQVCDGSCVGWEGFVLSVSGTFQSELGYKMGRALNDDLQNYP